MEDKTILKKEEIIEELKNLSNWIYKNNLLEKEFQFFKFLDLVNFLKKVISAMDEQNHHSDLFFDTKNKIIKISVTTHSKNAITIADVDFVKKIDNIVA
ncbi:4a-hydroxytetrahydrobiopterin dehydratase [Candidatus Woesearchaeota archaeon]|nr:4a-hydroxytetrahydrobiopterin dehydratase [Candidatus Woesearchaeota archaeon]